MQKFLKKMINYSILFSSFSKNNPSIEVGSSDNKYKINSESIPVFWVQFGQGGFRLPVPLLASQGPQPSDSFEELQISFRIVVLQK